MQLRGMCTSLLAQHDAAERRAVDDARRRDTLLYGPSTTIAQRLVLMHQDWTEPVCVRAIHGAQVCLWIRPSCNTAVVSLPLLPCWLLKPTVCRCSKDGPLLQDTYSLASTPQRLWPQPLYKICLETQCYLHHGPDFLHVSPLVRFYKHTCKTHASAL